MEAVLLVLPNTKDTRECVVATRYALQFFGIKLVPIKQPNETELHYRVAWGADPEADRIAHAAGYKPVICSVSGIAADYTGDH